MALQLISPDYLIGELLPDDLRIKKVIEKSSTSASALAVVSGEVDVALTTEIAARIHKLKFISRTRPIHMLWSVFVSNV